MRGIIFLTPFILILLLVFGVLMIMPIFFASLFPMFKMLMMGYFCLIIFLFVRGIIGGGLLTYAISAILIYIFVIRLWPLFAAGYMLYLVVGFGLTSIIFFGFQGVGMGRGRQQAAVMR